MKRIVYTRTDGGISVIHPAEGMRLAYRVHLPNGTVVPQVKRGEQAPPPLPVSHWLRTWPIDGATADWAQTEDEFVAWVANRDVPVTLATPFIDPKTGDSITMMQRMYARKLGLAFTDTPFDLVDLVAVPKDRTFREAWERDGVGGIIHNMPKAREIHRNNMRTARKPLLEKADADFFVAFEANDQTTMTTVAQRKQKLRDCTADPAIDAAATVDELKAVWPACLSG